MAHGLPKKFKHCYTGRLKPSSSQGSLTTPFEISLRSCNEEKKEAGLQRNASTANISTPHVKSGSV